MKLRETTSFQTSVLTKKFSELKRASNLLRTKWVPNSMLKSLSNQSHSQLDIPSQTSDKIKILKILLKTLNKPNLN